MPGTIAPGILGDFDARRSLPVHSYRAADKDSSLTGHLTVIIFDPGFIVHVCPDK